MCSTICINILKQIESRLILPQCHSSGSMGLRHLYGHQNGSVDSVKHNSKLSAKLIELVKKTATLC